MRPHDSRGIHDGQICFPQPEAVARKADRSFRLPCFPSPSIAPRPPAAPPARPCTPCPPCNITWPSCFGWRRAGQHDARGEVGQHDTRHEVGHTKRAGDIELDAREEPLMTMMLQWAPPPCIHAAAERASPLFRPLRHQLPAVAHVPHLAHKANSCWCCDVSCARVPRSTRDRPRRGGAEEARQPHVQHAHRVLQHAPVLHPTPHKHFEVVSESCPTENDQRSAVTS